MCSEQIETLLEVVASRQQYAARRQLCCREDPRSEAADPNLATTGEAFGEITQLFERRNFVLWHDQRDEHRTRLDFKGKAGDLLGRHIDAEVVGAEAARGRKPAALCAFFAR